MPVTFDLPLAAIAVAAALYVLGERRAVVLTGRPRGPSRRLRSGCFYAGLAALAIALASPLDDAAGKLLWAHMLQHVLLLTVAAPLLVLAAPWMSIWRPLPLAARRRAARAVARSPWWRPARFAASRLARPLPAFLAYNLCLALWHVPALYDLTLRNRAVHDLEHVTFIVLGVVLWAQVLESPPLRARLAPIQRVWYMTACSVAGWLLSLVLALYPSPLYSAYASLPRRPGGISELADQQIAGGVMLGPGSVTMTLFVFVGLYRWLGEPHGEPVRG